MTKSDILLFTSAGTGGLEAAITNTLSPGDKVLVVSIGNFGERFAAIAKTFGANVINLRFADGTAADPDEVRKALAKDPEIKAVTVTHNETSTAITNPLKAISAAVKDYDKLLIVDAVSSIGSIELPVDEWNCDVVVSGSQKSWMIPPGLAMISVSERGWKAAAEAKIPRYYFDFASAKRYAERGQTPWTPAVGVFFALDVALKLMEAEGLPNIIARHSRVGKYCREGIQSLGLELFGDQRYASNTVTAVKVPEGIDVKKLLGVARTECGVVLANGQASLEGKIFRVGHLGYVNINDIDKVIDALRYALPRVGFGQGEPAKVSGS